MTPFTERDLDLIEVALESAFSACRGDLDLQGEYRHALQSVSRYRLEEPE